MKKMIITVLSLGIILLIYFYLLMNDQAVQYPKKSLTSISKVHKKENTLLIKSDIKFPNAAVSVAVKPLTNPIKIPNNEPGLTYLEAFRESKYFTSCIFDLSYLQEKGEEYLIEKYKQNIEREISRNMLDNAYLPMQRYREHLNKCRNYLNYSEENISNVSDALVERYSNITPVTNEEKDLAKYIELLDTIRHMNYTKNNDNNADVKLIDQELKKIGLIIERFFITNKSSDALLNVMEVLNPSSGPLIGFKAKLIKKLQVQTRINDKDYLSILLDLATPLFACTLDYPCDQHSLLMSRHCILELNKFACDRDLENFYLNHYISTQQQTDVNLVFDYLLSHYAQD